MYLFYNRILVGNHYSDQVTTIHSWDTKCFQVLYKAFDRVNEVGWPYYFKKPLWIHFFRCLPSFIHPSIRWSLHIKALSQHHLMEVLSDFKCQAAKAIKVSNSLLSNWKVHRRSTTIYKNSIFLLSYRLAIYYVIMTCHITFLLSSNIRYLVAERLQSIGWMALALTLDGSFSY